MAYALIAGCTSQIDSIPTPVIASQAPNAGGIYLGNITTNGSSAGTSTSVPVTAIFDSNQNFVIYSNDKTALYAGLYSVNNTGITGQAQVYSLTSGSTTGTAIFSGTYESQTSITAIYTYNLSSNTTTTPDATGLINLPSYQTLIYNQPSATKLLQGTWANVDSFGHYTTSFTISGDGSVSGSSTTNSCNYSGTINTINLSYNVYSVSLNEGCTVTNGYATQALTGLGSIFPANTSTATPQQLVLGVASPTGARLFTLTLTSSN